MSIVIFYSFFYDLCKCNMHKIFTVALRFSLPYLFHQNNCPTCYCITVLIIFFILTLMCSTAIPKMSVSALHHTTEMLMIHVILYFLFCLSRFFSICGIFCHRWSATEYTTNHILFYCLHIDFSISKT